MSDLSAGTTVKALDTPPTVVDVEPDTFTFNSTAYGIDVDSGTHLNCGVAFTACTTGRAWIAYNASVDNDTAAQSTLCTPVVRTGSTIGSGTVVRAASDVDALAGAGTDGIHIGGNVLQTGLTPGVTYNVRLEHRVTGGIGTLLRRSVLVGPAT
jgi:hypothetical protein